MRIVKPYAKLIKPEVGAIDIGGELLHIRFDKSLSFIEWCGRISHRSEEAQTSDSWKRFIQSVVLDHGDWSIVEHISVSVDMLVDRGITHELVRHRLFSFTQESTRFVNYEKKMPPSFIYPKTDVECEYCLEGQPIIDTGEQGQHHLPLDQVSVKVFPCPYYRPWLISIIQAEESYKSLLSAGWRPQEARSVFPNALASRIIVTGNLRNWRHIFIMRTTKEAHPQMRQVMIPLLAEFKKTFPILFDDIEPDARQVDNLKKAR